MNLNAAITSSEREFDSSFPAIFEAMSISSDLYNKYKISEEFLTVIGISYVDTEMDSFSIPFGSNSFSPDIESSNANDVSIDPYLNMTYLSDFGLNLNSGVRLNNHSEYGSHFVFHFNPSYNFSLKNSKIKVFGSIGSAFITPSLFQLFAPGFGNSELEPQEDLTVEVGASLVRKDLFELSALFFSRNQDNMIDYVVTDFETFAGEYQNLEDEVIARGVEVEMVLKPHSSLQFTSNYAFTERKDGQFFRIPKHRINADLQYKINSSSQISTQFQFNSVRISPFLNDDFTENRILKAYSLVNLNYRQSFMKDKIQFYATVTNVFNETYEELYRFSTLGRNYRVGMSLRF